MFTKVLQRSASHNFHTYGKRSESRDLKVQCQKVSEALQWLLKFNPLYNHVTIHNERLEKFPLNGIASDLHETDLFLQSDDAIEKRTYENDDYNDECTNIDTR